MVNTVSRCSLSGVLPMVAMMLRSMVSLMSATAGATACHLKSANRCHNEHYPLRAVRPGRRGDVLGGRAIYRHSQLRYRGFYRDYAAVGVGPCCYYFVF